MRSTIACHIFTVSSFGLYGGWQAPQRRAYSSADGVPASGSEGAQPAPPATSASVRMMPHARAAVMRDALTRITFPCPSLTARVGNALPAPVLRPPPLLPRARRALRDPA